MFFPPEMSDFLVSIDANQENVEKIILKNVQYVL